MDAAPGGPTGADQADSDELRKTTRGPVARVFWSFCFSDFSDDFLSFGDVLGNCVLFFCVFFKFWAFLKGLSLGLDFF